MLSRRPRGGPHAHHFPGACPGRHRPPALALDARLAAVDVKMTLRLEPAGLALRVDAAHHSGPLDLADVITGLVPLRSRRRTRTAPRPLRRSLSAYAPMCSAAYG
ncbi:hypothetical protein [Streptomyces sp. NK15101]|uniref:hypothetical protein n=1 Tax=Streptomyces sp. NK15101 TaxID=2873261 RepID=UPI001CEC2ED6|nr:hypothetical protein [Streptomyces sp. NK15101]